MVVDADLAFKIIGLVGAVILILWQVSKIGAEIQRDILHLVKDVAEIKRSLAEVGRSVDALEVRVARLESSSSKRRRGA